MSDRFTVEVTLPASGDREDIYNTLRELAPTSELVDSATLKITNSKITNTDGVPRWVKYTIDYTDFTAAGLSEAITLFAAEAGRMIHHVVINVGTAWVIGGMSTLDLEVGISGTAGKFTAGSHAAGESTGVTGFVQAAGNAPESMSSSTNILITATSDAGNLNTATAGTCDVYVLTSNVING